MKKKEKLSPNLNWSACDKALYQDYLTRLEEAGVTAEYIACYHPIIQDLLDHGVKSVVDIGCGSGVQGYLFRAFGIRYVGIEGVDRNLRLGEVGETGDDLIIRKGFYPCDIPEAEGIDTALSMYALGSRDLWQYLPKQLLAIRKKFKTLYMATFSFPLRLTSLFMKVREWHLPDCEAKGSPSLVVYGR